MTRETFSFDKFNFFFIYFHSVIIVLKILYHEDLEKRGGLLTGSGVVTRESHV